MNDSSQKAINKIIKSYIVKRQGGYCALLVPLGEWDCLLEHIESVLREEAVQNELPKSV